jgi:hypothetical protein
MGHSHELADYLFIRFVKLQKLFLKDIAMTKRELQMDLRFRRFTFRIAEFRDKRSFLTALPPSSAIFAQTERDDRQI